MKHRRNPFPGVSTRPDRHGKLRHRLRRTVKGRKVDTYLPGPYAAPRRSERASRKRLKALVSLRRGHNPAPLIISLSFISNHPRSGRWRLQLASRSYGA